MNKLTRTSLKLIAFPFEAIAIIAFVVAFTAAVIAKQIKPKEDVEV